MSDEKEAAKTPSWIEGTGTSTSMEDPKARKGGGSLRFWMPKGETKTIIFLNEVNAPFPEGAPVIFEHSVPVGVGAKRWQNWTSCLQPLQGKCALCDWAEANNGIGRRYKGMFFSIIDCSSWTDRAGKEHKNVVKLLCAKKDTSEILIRKDASRKEAGESLRGAKFKVFRGSGDKTPSVGDDYEFVEMVDLKDYPNSDPLDYATLLEPSQDKVDAYIQQLKAEAGAFGETAEFKPPEQSGAQVKY